MGIEGSINFRRIDDRLTTSGLVDPERLSAMASEGYHAVINLLPEDSEYAIANERELLTENGIEYATIPVDFERPTHDDVERFTAAMDDHAQRSVHVHCAANYRVTAFYGLYAMRRGLYTAAEADELMHEFWDPAEYPVWDRFIPDEREALTRSLTEE